jgi:imidazole glycerol-phosphate synthase subunit HisF
LDVLKEISNAVSIPITALGGASCYHDFQKCYHDTLVNGLASGSVFVYQNKNKGVLINYPENKRKTLNLI